MIALKGLAILLCLQTGGETLAHALSIPIPGPVLGMVFLLIALQFEPLRLPVQAAAEFLLAHLSLLFVPVGVGVITHMDLVGSYGTRLFFVIVVSTWTGLAVTGFVLKRLLQSSPLSADVDD